MQKECKNEFPEIMGILNVTPDSFSDGNDFFHTNEAITRAINLFKMGADIIDIGGESTRPNAAPVLVDEEIARVIPVIEKVKWLVPASKISVDTMKYDVARAALKVGADMINDVSGLESDSRLSELAAEYNKSLVIMHMKGTPQTMQKNPVYEDVVREVYDFLNEKVSMAKSAGVKDIYIDVGIGFGKTLEHNLELLKHIDEFTKIGAKILLGISRKSLIGILTGIENPKDRDVATALMHAVLLRNKIDIIRVHNVELIKMLKTLYDAIS